MASKKVVKENKSGYRVVVRAEVLEFVPADRVFAKSSVAFMAEKSKTGKDGKLGADCRVSMGERVCVCVWEELTVQDVVEVVQGGIKRQKRQQACFP